MLLFFLLKNVKVGEIRRSLDGVRLSFTDYIGFLQAICHTTEQYYHFDRVKPVFSPKISFGEVQPHWIKFGHPHILSMGKFRHTRVVNWNLVAFYKVQELISGFYDHSEQFLLLLSMLAVDCSVGNLTGNSLSIMGKPQPIDYR